jgi:hypothetical protein
MHKRGKLFSLRLSRKDVDASPLAHAERGTYVLGEDKFDPLPLNGREKKVSILASIAAHLAQGRTTGKNSVKRLLKMLRIAQYRILTMLLQSPFAGRMLAGDDRSANLHEFTAKASYICAVANAGRTRREREVHMSFD